MSGKDNFNNTTQKFFMEFSCDCTKKQCECGQNLSLNDLSRFSFELRKYLNILFEENGLKVAKRYSRIGVFYPSSACPSLPSSNAKAIIEFSIEPEKAYMQFHSTRFKSKNKLYRKQIQKLFDLCDLDWEF